jgi:hypothetical protein
MALHKIDRLLKALITARRDESEFFDDRKESCAMPSKVFPQESEMVVPSQRFMQAAKLDQRLGLMIEDRASIIVSAMGPRSESLMLSQFAVL